MLGLPESSLTGLEYSPRLYLRLLRTMIFARLNRNPNVSSPSFARPSALSPLAIKISGPSVGVRHTVSLLWVACPFVHYDFVPPRDGHGGHGACRGLLAHECVGLARCVHAQVCVHVVWVLCVFGRHDV